MAGVATSSGVGLALLDYKRGNFKNGRLQRKRAEFRALNLRMDQAALWREDLRDITALTERRRNNYLIVNMLMLGMCLGLLADGQAYRSTYPWLFHIYMLTLGSAFTCLVMSVWFALHGAVIAQSVSVRLLTQLVRLGARSSAGACAIGDRCSMRPADAIPAQGITSGLFRMFSSGSRASSSPQAEPVPHFDLTAEDDDVETASVCTSLTETVPAASSNWSRTKYMMKLKAQHVAQRARVFWNESVVGQVVNQGQKEEDGKQQQQEQQRQRPALPPALRRHIALARRAATKYQCYDAFARVAMTFGANQLLHTLMFFAFGCIANGGISPWPAWCAIAIIQFMTLTLLKMDFELSEREARHGHVLTFLEPACTAAAMLSWSCTKEGPVVKLLVCMGFALRAVWLLYMVQLCGIVMKADGAALPMKLRAVQYLDVFWWLDDFDDEYDEQPEEASIQDEGGAEQLADASDCGDTAGPGGEIGGSAGRSSSKQSQKRSDDRFTPMPTPRRVNMAGFMADTMQGTFDVSPAVGESCASLGEGEVACGYTKDTGSWPATVFKGTTNFLAFVWIVSSAVPFAWTKTPSARSTFVHAPWPVPGLECGWQWRISAPPPLHDQATFVCMQGMPWGMGPRSRRTPRHAIRP